MRDYSGKVNKEHISIKKKEAEYQYQYIQTITKIYLVFRLSHYLFQKLDKPFKKKKDNLLFFILLSAQEKWKQATDWTMQITHSTTALDTLYM